MKRLMQLLRTLARKYRIFLVPAGSTLYVLNPVEFHMEVPPHNLIFEEGAKIAYGPPPRSFMPDLDAPTGSREFTLAMDMLARGWQAPAFDRDFAQPRDPDKQFFTVLYHISPGAESEDILAHTGAWVKAGWGDIFDERDAARSALLQSAEKRYERAV